MLSGVYTFKLVQYMDIYLFKKIFFKSKKLGLPKMYGNKKVSVMSSAYWMSIKSYGDSFTPHHCLAVR